MHNILNMVRISINIELTRINEQVSKIIYGILKVKFYSLQNGNK